MTDAQLNAVCTNYSLTPSEQLFAALRYVHMLGHNKDVMKTANDYKPPIVAAAQ